MDKSNLSRRSIQECLRTLGISSLGDWDVLIFIHRHRSNLASADHIARLLGYPSNIVGTALDRLESKSLICRSRNSQGIRLYEIVSTGSSTAQESCLQQLIAVADSRMVRLVLLKLLQQNSGLHIASKGKAK